MKTIKTKPLTENEQKELIKEFKFLLSERPDYIEFITRYNKEDVTDQACYISSSDNIGIYFPNNNIILKKGCEFICLSINEETKEKGFIYYLEYRNKDDKIIDKVSGYYFQPINSLIYDSEELEIKKEIEKNIKEYKKSIELLKSIKRVYKKDGSDFQKLSNNFIIENGSIIIESDYLKYNTEDSKYKTEVKLFKSFGYCDYKEYYLYIYNKEEINASRIEEEIKEQLEKNKKYLKEEEENFKKLHHVYKKIKKLAHEIYKTVSTNNLEMKFYNKFDKIIRYSKD